MPKPVCFFHSLELYDHPLDQLHPHLALYHYLGLGDAPLHLCHLGTFPTELLSDGIGVGAR